MNFMNILHESLHHHNYSSYVLCMQPTFKVSSII